MELTFCPLFSGSSGNALLVAGGDTRILIDAGLSGKTVAEALASVGVLPETIDAILVTHEHSDHVKGVGILSRKYRLPIYANEPTWDAMARTVGNVACGCQRFFDQEGDFYIGDLAIRPFAIPHDAAAPVGYRVYYGGRSLSTATDMGYFKKSVGQAIAGSDLVLLESNHDPDMLMQNQHYSAALKQRILSTHGHLSNQSCAEALLRLYDTGVRHVVLGHLSGENNTPELAMNTAIQSAEDHGLAPGSDVHIDMAWRDHVGSVYTIA